MTYTKKRVCNKFRKFDFCKACRHGKPHQSNVDIPCYQKGTCEVDGKTICVRCVPIKNQ